MRRTPTRTPNRTPNRTPIKSSSQRTRNINISAPLDINILMQPNARSGLNTPVPEGTTPDIQYVNDWTGTRSPLIEPGKNLKTIRLDQSKLQIPQDPVNLF